MTCCPWFNNPSPASFTRLPADSAAVALDAVTARARSLLPGHSLPLPPSHSDSPSPQRATTHAGVAAQGGAAGASLAAAAPCARSRFALPALCEVAAARVDGQLVQYLLGRLRGPTDRANADPANAAAAAAGAGAGAGAGSEGGGGGGSPEQTAAVQLALLGWQADTAPAATAAAAAAVAGAGASSAPPSASQQQEQQQRLLCCRLCQRRVGVWNFRPLAGAGAAGGATGAEGAGGKPAFDPISEHRWFCPWVACAQPQLHAQQQPAEPTAAPAAAAGGGARKRKRGGEEGGTGGDGGGEADVAAEASAGGLGSGPGLGLETGPQQGFVSHMWLLASQTYQQTESEAMQARISNFWQQHGALRN
jgi:hypothetical protein